MTTGKIIRGVLGLVVLVYLLVTVNGWWREYKKATPGKVTAETTATVPASSTPVPKPGEPSAADKMAASTHVLILIDGLNFREKPDATGANIRAVKKGERLILVSQTGTWLQLQDTSGKVGWVNNNAQYIRIEKK